jgi:hypothetical protein
MRITGPFLFCAKINVLVVQTPQPRRLGSSPWKGEQVDGELKKLRSYKLLLCLL